MIITELLGELQKMNEELQAQKVEKAYRRSKNVLIQKYVDKVQWPKCPIRAELVMQHFVQALPLPRRDSQEADKRQIFYLAERLPSTDSPDM
jgi:hypothetical protein